MIPPNNLKTLRCTTCANGVNPTRGSTVIPMVQETHVTLLGPAAAECGRRDSKAGLCGIRAQLQAKYQLSSCGGAPGFGLVDLHLAAAA